MARRVQAILLDAVGTLIRPAQPVAATYQQFALRHGIARTEEDIADRFRRAFARQEALDAARGNWRTSESLERDRWRQIVGDTFAEAKHAPPPDSLFEELWDHYAKPGSWHVFPDAVRVAQALNGRYALGIASNWDQRLGQVAAGLTPLRVFRHHFVSAQLGFRKPGIEFFRAIERTLRLAPDELLLVGDDPYNDVAGARGAGWHAVLLDRKRRDPDVDSLASLDQLLAMLS